MARQSQARVSVIKWVSVGGGQIAVGHRPKIKAIKTLPDLGVTHILTLLSEKEGGAEIGAVIKKAGIGWSWFPLKSAAPPGEKRVQEVRLLYGELKKILAAGGRIFVHCAAGIHRTGMITYGLLRSMGFTEDEAKATLHTLRPETGEGVGESRLAWGDRFG